MSDQDDTQLSGNQPSGNQPSGDGGTDQAVVPQRIGFYAAVSLFAGWLIFLGYLASLTWRG